jgi:hypothetical protein
MELGVRNSRAQAAFFFPVDLCAGIWHLHASNRRIVHDRLMGPQGSASLTGCSQNLSEPRDSAPCTGAGSFYFSIANVQLRLQIPEQ